MATQTPLFLLLVAFLHSVAHATLPLNRSDFPSDFIFGAASSAYQYEGASDATYKEKSIWDTFSEESSDKITDHSTGATAVDFYHHFRHDVRLMKELGFEAFRYSIAWSRLMKFDQRLRKMVVNPEGAAFYASLTDIVVNEGMKPFVTIFHWDTPQALEDRYRSFLRRRIVEEYKAFADACFNLFGDKVQHWTTFNEPHNFCDMGYATGQMAPGRCSPHLKYQYRLGVGRDQTESDQFCKEGDSATEPYVVGHHIILCHAAAVKLYREKYQPRQKGVIGMTLNVDWIEPYEPSNPDDVEAVQRALDFHYGWFMDPITYGHYPDSMVKNVGRRLPRFTSEESEMVKMSYDFIGINYYSTDYAQDVRCPGGPVSYSYLTDACVNVTKKRHNFPIGPPSDCLSWLCSYPRGIRDLMKYTKYNYDNPMVIITENGYGSCNEGNMRPDEERLNYHHDHMVELSNFIKETPDNNVKGYFVWSFLDNFEWMGGYSVRFGLVFVNYTDPNLTRIPKDSAKWFQKFFKP